MRHMPNAPDPGEGEGRPFIIEHRRGFSAPGRFEPAARLAVEPYLRTSGLLSLMSDGQARLLLALLTFVSPNGQVQATARELARALGLPVPLTAWKLDRFAKRRFRDQVFVYRIDRREGESVYALSRHVVAREHAPEPPADPPPIVAAGREAVVAESRARYSQPREAVEAEVMRQLGHAAEELADTPQGSAYRQLRALGMAPADIGRLLATYGTADVLQQLAWLPERRAKHPLRYLLAALRDGYAGPQHFPAGRAAGGTDGSDGAAPHDQPLSHNHHD
jgi:hypothetical protein